ncbi:MAG: hypothetical protein JSW50_06345, partial [Candidatus Latescibacterota bacterium]
MRDIFDKTRPCRTGLARRARFVTAVVAAAVLICAASGCSDDGAVSPAPEPVCTDYSQYIHLTGTADTPGSARRATASGDLMYAAVGTAGLHVIDISNPSLPAAVTTL